MVTEPPHDPSSSDSDSSVVEDEQFQAQRASNDEAIEDQVGEFLVALNRLRQYMRDRDYPMVMGKAAEIQNMDLDNNERATFNNAVSDFLGQERRRADGEYLMELRHVIGPDEDTAYVMGTDLFKKELYRDSVEALLLSMRLTPSLFTRVHVAHTLENARTHNFCQWHWEMVNDAARNKHFRDEIYALIARTGAKCGADPIRILDLGCGSGILTAICAKALAPMHAPTASAVVGIDSSPGMSSIAYETMHLNNCDEKATILAIHSCSLDGHKDKPYNMAVTETLDCAIFGERICSSLLDLYEEAASTTFGGVVPRRVCLYVAMCECNYIAKNHSYEAFSTVALSQEVYVNNCTESELPESAYDCEHMDHVPGGYRMLSEPYELLNVDFQNVDQLRNVAKDELAGEAVLTAKENGRMDCVVAWFVADNMLKPDQMIPTLRVHWPFGDYGRLIPTDFYTGLAVNDPLRLIPLIPSNAQLVVQLVYSERLAHHSGLHFPNRLEVHQNVNLDAMRDCQIRYYEEVDDRYFDLTPRSAPAAILDFDLKEDFKLLQNGRAIDASVELLDDTLRSFSIYAQSGKCNALIYWFNIYTKDDQGNNGAIVSFRNMTHRVRAFVFDEPHDLHLGLSETQPLSTTVMLGGLSVRERELLPLPEVPAGGPGFQASPTIRLNCTVSMIYGQIVFTIPTLNEPPEYAHYYREDFATDSTRRIPCGPTADLTQN